MKLKTEIYEAQLSAAAIDECSDRVRSFLNECRLPKRDVLRYAMTVEEILLKTTDTAAGEIPLRLITGIRFFRPFVAVELDGKSLNVYADREQEQGVLGGGILKNLGLSPEYSYTGETNRYNFRVKRKSLSPIVTLMIALAAALLLGAMGYLFSDGTRTMLVDSVLQPLNDAFLDILGCIAGPMIFLSVAWGIYGIGDAATLKRIGKKLIMSYVGTIFVMVVIIGWLCLPVFSLNFSGGNGGGGELSAVFAMLLGIIPKDIFSPFVNGNTLQIIFLAVAIGIAMLFLGQKTDFVAKIVEQINYIVQFLIEAISKMVPYFIFIVILKMIWGDTGSVLAGIGKLFAVFTCAVIIMIALIVGYTALKNKVTPSVLIKKGLPTLIIALTTASSAAAFGTNMNACHRDYGIDGKISSFGIPLGMVTSKPTTAVNYMIVSLFFAELYGINVSVSWIVVMMITVCILAIATPPIPGGAMTSYTVLLAQLGIPVEALAVALACDAIFDFIDTGSDQFILPFILLNQAGKMGMVDRNVLRSAKVKRS